MSRRNVHQTVFMIVALLLVLSSLTLQVSFAQVTLSRNWGPGKRSTYGNGNCGATAKSAANVCHVLLTELAQYAACEVRAILPVDEEQDITDSQMHFRRPMD